MPNARHTRPISFANETFTACQAFSQYFKHRGRMRFIRRFKPASLPFAFAYIAAYIVKMLLLRAWPEAWAVVTGSRGMKAPATIRNRLGPAAAKIAFARAK